MNHRELSVLMAGLLATSLFTGIVAAEPPRPGTEGNGLTENESATLWSHDADTYISQEEYRERYGENRSAVHQVANGTDVTFKRPPATAATWTRNDFEDLNASGSDTSVYPPHADLENEPFTHFLHPNDQETATERFQTLMSEGEHAPEIEYRVRAIDGELKKATVATAYGYYRGEKVA